MSPMAIIIARDRPRIIISNDAERRLQRMRSSSRISWFFCRVGI
jgi:hypothetical protein